MFSSIIIKRLKLSEQVSRFLFVAALAVIYKSSRRRLWFSLKVLGVKIFMKGRNMMRKKKAKKQLKYSISQILQKYINDE